MKTILILFVAMVSISVHAAEIGLRGQWLCRTQSSDSLNIEDDSLDGLQIATAARHLGFALPFAKAGFDPRSVLLNVGTNLTLDCDNPKFSVVSNGVHIKGTAMCSLNSLTVTAAFKGNGVRLNKLYKFTRVSESELTVQISGSGKMDGQFANQNQIVKCDVFRPRY